eukprot:TRINITY_DN1558_c0_g1_i30.p2 TRINITY_DN1558_c0_g1~~TRINITY_DN1558_c0_g1_i30.p2  ORF type:complete len:110 (+),score=14.03 TRINITY_DN1558_c0_g1_i30:219-548(+)
MFRIGLQARLSKEYIVDNIMNELRSNPDGLDTYREFHGRDVIEMNDLIEWFIEMDMSNTVTNLNKVEAKKPNKERTWKNQFQCWFTKKDQRRNMNKPVLRCFDYDGISI